MEFHEAANIFPLDEENIDALAADIKKNGLQVPIETMDGKILDGRRRFMACRKAKAEMKLKAVVVDDPVAHVLSLNLHRRHLNPSQLAMVGARAREMYDQHAKERQKEHGKTAPGKSRTLPANLPEVKGDARDLVGNTVGVSGKLIDSATKVQERGIPALAQAVDAGELTVTAAATIAERSPAEQKEIMRADKPFEKLREIVSKNGDEIEEPESLKDAQGHTVPDACADAFRALDNFAILDSLCRQLKAGIDELTRISGGEQLKTINTSEHLDVLKRGLKDTRPYAVCPWCQGKRKKDCKGCSGSGWVTKITWDNKEKCP